jgi:hypothetical protein
MNSTLSRMESYQYPAAHFGHLTDQQQDSLERFKKISQERGYYFPKELSGQEHASHDDETML